MIPLRPCTLVAAGLLAGSGCSPPAETPPPLPAAAATQSAAPADPRAWAAALQGASCLDEGEAVPDPSRVERHSLGPGLDLVQVLCHAAAYQGIHAYLLEDRRARPSRVTLLRFPGYDTEDGFGWAPVEHTELAGVPSFHAERAELRMYTRFRGLGDCGQLARYRFEDGLPVLADLRVKLACDGEVVEPEDWPRVPRADVPGPQGAHGRDAVLAALRREVEHLHRISVTLEVRHLEVVDGWAWVAADPLGEAGARYETVAALMREAAGAWSVVEFMPGFGEREFTELEEACRYFADLLRRRPGVPPQVFPAEDRPPCM